jgi:nitrogen regulatory protein PII
MKLIMAIIKSDKLEELRDALARPDARGLMRPCANRRDGR